MPTIGSKVSQEELDAIVDHANRQGLTVSNFVRMVLMKEINQTRSDVATNANGDDANKSTTAKQDSLEELLFPKRRY
jgi:hypothetical protein